ncbi:MAG: nitroreductase family protein [Anaerolineae bacterium]
MPAPIPVPDILARRSIRAFTDQPVTEAQITRLLEAAMAAPSARNTKPWSFVVVTERETLNRLIFKNAASMLAQATLCIAVCGEPKLSEYWVQDAAAATENILLAATGMGLGSVWIGVHPNPASEQAVRDVLGIPAHIHPLCLIAIGHPAETKPPRTQYDAACVHRERW